MRIPFFTGSGDVKVKSTPEVWDFVDNLHNPAQIRKAEALMKRVIGKVNPTDVSDSVSDNARLVLWSANGGLLGSVENNSAVSIPENGKYIWDDTILVIPEHLLMQAPFCIVAQWWDTILLSALQNLWQDQKSMAIRMLSSLDIKIINWDKEQSIKLNERIPVWDNTWSLHQYLSSGHQIWLTELR